MNDIVLDALVEWRDARAAFHDAISKDIAEGEAIVQRATEQYLRRDDPLTRIRNRAVFPAQRSLPKVDTSVQPSSAEMIENIVKAEGRGRPMVAAFGLARLREFHEATNPGEPWADFARKNIPLGRDRIEELIGTMVHRNNLIRCVKCGIAAKCPCGCGVPYVSDHPWANPDPLTKTSALERAAEAVAANPEKSNRAIAAEIGVSAQTVKRARAAGKTVAHDVAVDVAVDVEVDERVGRDGRRRKLPAKAADAPKTDDKEVAQLIGDLLDFTFNYSQKITAWRESGQDCDREPRDALMFTIHQCADEVLRLAQAIDGR
jgi:hypothetical protein